MKSNGEESRNRRKRGEKTRPRDGAVPRQQECAEKGSRGPMWGAFAGTSGTLQVYEHQMCALGIYKQDISLEWIPELFLSTEF